MTVFNGLKLTNGDISIVDGKLKTLSGADYAAQDLKSRISIFFGENFLDIDSGVPWQEQILIKNPNPTIINAIFINEILKTPGLIKITDYSIIPDESNRTAEVKATYTTRDGVKIFNEVIEIG